MTQATIAGLYVYPIKSCRGVALTEATLLPTGLAHDRRWMLVNDKHMMVTQREHPRMALITPTFEGTGLRVSAPEMPDLYVDDEHSAGTITVTVWRDQVQALDAGDEIAAWFSQFLNLSVRLVRFDDTQQRLSSREWTGDVAAPNRFSDGFPLLVIANASLDDLNSRLPIALPMQRFRPNIVLNGLPAYAEDDVHELRSDDLLLRLVKPCTRCKITTIDPATGIAQVPEPIATLMKYRRHPTLRGVTFGQNAIVLGQGKLRVGQVLDVSYKTAS